MEDRDLKKLLRYICGLILLAGGILVYDGIRRQNRPASPEPVVQGGSAVSFSPPMREPSVRDGSISFTPPADYELVVGANPRFNDKQVFFPPTGSVVITNREQLQVELEKSRPVAAGKPQ